MIYGCNNRGKRGGNCGGIGLFTVGTGTGYLLERKVDNCNKNEFSAINSVHCIVKLICSLRPKGRALNSREEIGGNIMI